MLSILLEQYFQKFRILGLKVLTSFDKIAFSFKEEN